MSRKGEKAPKTPWVRGGQPHSGRGGTGQTPISGFWTLSLGHRGKKVKARDKGCGFNKSIVKARPMLKGKRVVPEEKRNRGYRGMSGGLPRRMEVGGGKKSIRGGRGRCRKKNNQKHTLVMRRDRRPPGRVGPAGTNFHIFIT